MKILILISILLTAGFASASVEPEIANEDLLIVKLQPRFTKDGLQGFATMNNMQIVKTISPSLNLYLVKVNNSRAVGDAMRAMGANPAVKYAARDHKLTMRANVIPNDPKYSQIWSLTDVNSGADINAPAAWEIGTGGTDAAGNDIVVAVVDGGVEVNHPDLKENMWVNKGEIPGNGIDDDENGYVDDIHGWDAYGNDGSIPASGHGTHVAGTIGAKGNNNKQVTGVSWDVKVMAVAGSSFSTSTVMTAYGYVLEQKKLWMATNGEKGANVVATNSSFGIDYADCTDNKYKVWNDMYTAMGEAGILSAAATANNNVNIDNVGDVPTGCDSPYIISVTNITKAGKKASAGYGATTIDIGAPGTGILSTYSGGGTTQLTGTSMATPHVAGAVGFLHSVASEDFNTLFMDDPAKGALLMKDMILGMSAATEALEAKTVTGGRLDLYASAMAVNSFEIVDEERTQAAFFSSLDLQDLIVDLFN